MIAGSGGNGLLPYAAKHAVVVVTRATIRVPQSQANASKLIAREALSKLWQGSRARGIWALRPRNRAFWCCVLVWAAASS